MNKTEFYSNLELDATGDYLWNKYSTETKSNEKLCNTVNILKKQLYFFRARFLIPVCILVTFISNCVFNKVLPIKITIAHPVVTTVNTIPSPLDDKTCVLDNAIDEEKNVIDYQCGENSKCVQDNSNEIIKLQEDKVNLINGSK